MINQVEIYQLQNGLTLLLDHIPTVESVAYDMLLPGGIYRDAEERIGSSLLLAELLGRGAGDFSAVELSNSFDELGIVHSEGASKDRFHLRASLLSDNLERGLELLSLMVLEPTLPPEEIESIRSVLMQDILSLQDNPSRWASVELQKRYFQGVFTRPGLGTKEGLERTSGESLRADWARWFRPEGSVLSIAGNFDPQKLRLIIERLFGQWSGAESKMIPFSGSSSPKAYHIEHDSAQVQILLAVPSTPFGDPQYYAAKMASQVLSGGMFGRLFTEVREKRGLCYSVYAQQQAGRDYGLLLAYAGTTTDRADETLLVLKDVLSTMIGTITEEELHRAKVNMKAALVIGEETSSARATSNAYEWWIGDRVRSEEEIFSSIDRVGCKEIDAYLESFPVAPYTLLTLGKRPLEGEQYV
jgi:predicted Zn-dependent peptidase